jgi:hypothetical protein
VLLGIAGVVVALLFAKPDLWYWVIGPLRRGELAFRDLQATLASFEGWAAGIDVLREPNPFHPTGQLTPGPTWSRWLGLLGLRSQHALVLGPVVVIAYYAVAMTILSPRRWHDVALGVVVLLSPSILLGVERGNIDLIICVAAVAAARLARWRGTLGALAVVLLGWWFFLFKLFPILLVGALLGIVPTWRRALTSQLAGLALVALYVVLAWDEVALLSTMTGAARGIFTFGSPLLPRHLGWPDISRWLLVVTSVATAVLGGFRLDWKALSVGRRRRDQYMFGAAVLLGAFFLGASFGYRFVFVALMLPALIAAARSARASGGRRLARVLLLLLLVRLWVEPLAIAAGFDGSSWRMPWLPAVALFQRLLSWPLVTGLLALAVALARPTWARWQRPRRSASAAV